MQVESKIFEASLEYFMNMLKVTFSKPNSERIEVVNTQGPQQMREIARRLGGQVKFPYMATMLESIQKDRESYPGRNMKRLTVNGAKNLDNGTVLKYQLKPIEANITTKFICQDYADGIDFCKKLIYLDETFNFVLMQGNTRINIHVLTDDAIQFPEIQLDDIDSIFQFETVIKIKTYIGTVEQFKLVKNVTVNTNIPYNDYSDFIVVSSENFVQNSS